MSSTIRWRFWLLLCLSDMSLSWQLCLVRSHVVLHQRLSFLPTISWYPSSTSVKTWYLNFYALLQSTQRKLLFIARISSSSGLPQSNSFYLEDRLLYCLSLFSGHYRGNPASTFTITWWMRARAYTLRQNASCSLMHSSRWLGVSWSFWH